MSEEVEPTSESPDATLLPQADFLFHLYRGSELVHDNRLLEAQSELEYALSLVPTDARTRGLLAVVYFRSGFYARAIGVYRGLLRVEETGADPTLRLNLALCYLKTGQSEEARTLLEALVVEDVQDLRAWGYLALALERLGYVDQAREAFERAGQPDLARRMVEQRGASRPRPSRFAGAVGSVDGQGDADALAHSAKLGFEPLDAGELRVDLARADSQLTSVAGVAIHDASPPLPPRARHDTLGWGTTQELPPREVWATPPPLANLIEDARVERGGAAGVNILGTHLAKIDLEGGSSARSFAFRLEALRSYHGSLDADILPRQSHAGSPPAHEVAGETFGGIGSPFASMKGPGQLIVGPRTGQRMHAFTLDRDVVFFRETVIVGFDMALTYENGRLAGAGHEAQRGDAMSLVQFKGSGTLLVEIGAELLSLDVKPGGITVRKEVVVGWVGRLMPHALLAAEAPCGQRGLIVFSGEGTVLVSAK